MGLGDLADVNIATMPPVAGDMLVFDGATRVPAARPVELAGGAERAPAADQVVLRYVASPALTPLADRHLDRHIGTAGAPRREQLIDAPRGLLSIETGRHLSGVADPFNGHIDESRIGHVQRSDGRIESPWDSMSIPVRSPWQQPRSRKAGVPSRRQ